MKLPKRCATTDNPNTEPLPPAPPWLTCVERGTHPRYMAIAQGIQEALRTGLLQAGERLPPQRHLAHWLGVNLSTVTRAADTLRHMGFIQGEVGRGTYLTRPTAADAPASLWDHSQPRDYIDLSHNFPERNPGLGDAHQWLQPLTPAATQQWLSLQVDAGNVQHRASMAQWLTQRGLQVTPEHITISCGAQHGLLLSLAALTRPGDLVLTEELTYYGLKSTCAMLGRNLVGVRMDAQGLLPEALDMACQHTGARVLVCCPTLHNPTTATMGEARRREIVQVARRRGLTMVEDDVYGLLPQQHLPALASLAPERTLYVSSLSKLVGPGLRLGCVATPAQHTRALGVALRASTLMASPLNAASAQALLQPDVTLHLLQQLRQETAARQQLVAACLPTHAVVQQPGSFYFGLHIGPQWTAQQFAQAAHALGVGVTPYDVFEATPLTGQGMLRVCHNAAPSRALLTHALHKLAMLLTQQTNAATRAASGAVTAI